MKYLSAEQHGLLPKQRTKGLLGFGARTMYSDSKEWYLDAYVSPRSREKKGVLGYSVSEKALSGWRVSGYCVSTQKRQSPIKSDRASQTPAVEMPYLPKLLIR